MKDSIVLNPASKNDCKDLWIWRNHPVVLRGSFNEEPVPWEEHKKWFYLKIKDRDAKIYIAVLGNDKIGVIRFQIEKNFFRVSVNLNPDFFGKGLGSKIIKLGTEKVLNETRIVKPFLAEIKGDNIVAQKAFSKAGYRYAEKTEDRTIYKK